MHRLLSRKLATKREARQLESTWFPRHSVSRCLRVGCIRNAVNAYLGNATPTPFMISIFSMQRNGLVNRINIVTSNFYLNLLFKKTENLVNREVSRV